MGDYLATFAELRLADANRAGGKGANLGEMVAAQLPVPPGFVILRSCYEHVVSAGETGKELERLHAQALDSSGEPLQRLCTRMRDLVHSAAFGDTARHAILAAYHDLGDGVAVAVRSSAVGEDSTASSFAGMNLSRTNIRGDDALIAAVTDCWASLFTPRVVTYRGRRGMRQAPAMAVVVQRMVAAEQAGVAFTADPSSGRRDRIVIDAARGQGEVVVSGAVEPDTYILDADGPRLIESRTGRQTYAIVAGPDGDRRVSIDDEQMTAPVLTEQQAVAIARLALAVQDHYRGKPQDIEWAIDSEGLWLVQARPITMLPDAPASFAPASPSDAVTIVRGLAVAPGVAEGAVRILSSPEQGDALKAGEVLVAPMTSPDWLPTIARSAAVVTDSGGMTCHAAIVARELGVPCVVGTRTATTTLVDGSLVTVDGSAGEVRAGHAPTAAVTATAAVPPPPGDVGIPTATKIYVNLALPDAAERVASTDVDGVGLLRAETLLSQALGGRHPRELIARGEQGAFIEQMSHSLHRITAAFHPRPVIYRATDLRSNEFRALDGGSRYEPVEQNPMIGYRGCYRYIREPEVFDLELAAIARVREATPNLHLMIPFVVRDGNWRPVWNWSTQAHSASTAGCTGG
ncbi:phosphoenolpyruvate synthase [Nocardia cyriacigeorgica]|uniref:Phosphoenolpyruvate synthase n=2 Tax=Nocardia TaxID=1817 RepID=H6RA77_NOCCG